MSVVNVLEKSSLIVSILWKLVPEFIVQLYFRQSVLTLILWFPTIFCLITTKLWNVFLSLHWVRINVIKSNNYLLMKKFFASKSWYLLENMIVIPTYHVFFQTFPFSFFVNYTALGLWNIRQRKWEFLIEFVQLKRLFNGVENFYSPSVCSCDLVFFLDCFTAMFL